MNNFIAPDSPLSERELTVLREIRDEWCATNSVSRRASEATQALMDLISWHKFGIRNRSHLRAMLDVE